MKYFSKGNLVFDSEKNQKIWLVKKLHFTLLRKKRTVPNPPPPSPKPQTNQLQILNSLFSDLLHFNLPLPYHLLPPATPYLKFPRKTPLIPPDQKKPEGFSSVR